MSASTFAPSFVAVSSALRSSSAASSLRSAPSSASASRHRHSACSKTRP
ncbi:hypothetical protein [Lentzea guizhouensis]